MSKTASLKILFHGAQEHLTYNIFIEYNIKFIDKQ